MNKLKKILLILLSTLFFLFISMGVKIYLELNKITTKRVCVNYQKQRKIYIEQSKLFNFAENTIKTEDKINLAVKVLYNQNSKRVIILCHGYFESKEFLINVVKLFKHENIVLFDFRSHGDSDGNIISWGIEEYKDILAVLNFVSTDNRLKNKLIYGIGYSMGAAALSKAQVYDSKFKGIVLDSCFANLEIQANRMFNFVTGFSRYLISYAEFIFKYIMHKNLDFNVLEFIKQIKVPILIIHSKTDKITPVSDAYLLYNAANCPKELWIAESGIHARIFLEYPNEYKERILKFFKKTENNYKLTNAPSLVS